MHGGGGRILGLPHNQHQDAPPAQIQIPKTIVAAPGGTDVIPPFDRLAGNDLHSAPIAEDCLVHAELIGVFVANDCAHAAVSAIRQPHDHHILRSQRQARLVEARQFKVPRRRRQPPVQQNHPKDDSHIQDRETEQDGSKGCANQKQRI